VRRAHELQLFAACGERVAFIGKCLARVLELGDAALGAVLVHACRVGGRGVFGLAGKLGVLLLELAHLAAELVGHLGALAQLVERTLLALGLVGEVAELVELVAQCVALAYGGANRGELRGERLVLGAEAVEVRLGRRELLVKVGGAVAVPRGVAAQRVELGSGGARGGGLGGGAIELCEHALDDLHHDDLLVVGERLHRGDVRVVVVALDDDAEYEAQEAQAFALVLKVGWQRLCVCLEHVGVAA